MSISAWIEKLPIEDWAADVGRFVRRSRRRVARRPVRTLAIPLGALAIVAIVSNALWDQSEQHPAPLFASTATEERTDAPIVASHAPMRAVATESDPLVEKVQRALFDKGYYDGALDGVLGAQTSAAIRKYEAFAGMRLSGEPTLGLLASLSGDGGGEAQQTAVSPAGALEDEARAVTAEPVQVVAAPLPVVSAHDIQRALNTHGYGPLSVDGVMGPKSRAALSQFAKDNGLPEQGMTPQVLEALAQPPR
ncbi:MAG: peptidoglycan-binding domain-containing protein [Pseudomonadota bacterium]